MAVVMKRCGWGRGQASCRPGETSPGFQKAQLFDIVNKGPSGDQGTPLLRGLMFGNV